MLDLTQIIVALIGLLATVLTVCVIPWIKTKVGAARWAQLESIVHTSVLAAEQMGGTKLGQEMLASGKAKLRYATKRVDAELAKLGLRYDADTVRAAIEAAVLGMRQEQPLPVIGFEG